MDEKFGNSSPDSRQEESSGQAADRPDIRVDAPADKVSDLYDKDDSRINSFTMDDKGNIRSDRNGTVALAGSSRTYLILGWISAAFTAFISPWFAIAGIVFGVLANRNTRGSGNAVIITNVVLAAVNLLFGLFLIAAMRRMMLF